MDSKDKFYEIILDFYKNAVGDKIPNDILKLLCRQLSENFYDEYTRFRAQYPKSIKRYSSFQTKDLNHPLTFELVIKFFKDKFGIDYKKYSCLLLNMTDSELADFEKNRQEFYNMF